MRTAPMIAAHEFCSCHGIQLSFLQDLHRSGLIALRVEEEKFFVPDTELPQLEKLVRFYQELDINVEGLETITYLLQRVVDLQRQVLLLTNRLHFYEEEGR